MSGEEKLEAILETDLRDLLVVSYIVLCNNMITNKFIERSYDMPVQAWSALLAIVEFPGITAKEIQLLFPRPQNTISRALSLLESRGLIDQKTSATDARVKYLRATATGAALLAEIRARSHQRQEEMFAPLDAEERQAFFRLASKIARGPGLKESSVLQ